MASFKDLQLNLRADGYDPGEIDGLWGPKTLTALLGYVTHKRISDRMAQLGQAMAIELPKKQIVRPLQIAHFIAQACHETDRFLFMEEIWGPTPAQLGYEGRADLGNTQKGDGYRYRGRGIFQLTGRANYAAYGRLLNLPLLEKPDLAAQPFEAVAIACQFWSGRALNDLADQDNVTAITKRINGGLNGLAERKIYLDRIKTVWGI